MAAWKLWLAAALVGLSIGPLEGSCEEQGEDLMQSLQSQFDGMLKIFTPDSDATKDEPDKLDPFEHLVLDVVPTFFNQRPNNENGTESQFKEYILQDDSNDDAWRLTGVSNLPIISFISTDQPSRITRN